MELNGLLLVNKPVGPTSFDIIRALRRTTGMRKIGHAGTLDPQASGLMLLLFGKATKQAQSLTKLDKEYVATAKLGSNSTTGDEEGEKEAVSDRQPSREEVEMALTKFKGEITQTPSAYSAIKIDGVEAYKRVRRGETVEMPSRQVKIYELELLEYDYPLLKLLAKVSSGTYIRTLAEDIGADLGTGAYLTGLIRTQVGDYRLEQAVPMDAAPDEIIAHLEII